MPKNIQSVSLTGVVSVSRPILYTETHRPFDLIPSLLYSDNLGATKMAKDPIFRSKTKHIDISAHHIRDESKKGRISVDHIAGKQKPGRHSYEATPKSRAQCLCFYAGHDLAFLLGSRRGGVLRYVFRLKPIISYFVSNPFISYFGCWPRRHIDRWCSSRIPQCYSHCH